MEHLLNQKIKDIENSGIRTFANSVSGIEGMISFTIGQPDFATPEHVKQAGIQAINDNRTAYTHNSGDLDLREAASAFVKEKYNLHYNPLNEVLVTIGASQGIDIALRTIISEGDEVILPGPTFPAYEPIVFVTGGKPIYADTTKTQFKLTAEVIASYVTEKTKCIIIPYPSNPTGATLTREELIDIADMLRGKDIIVIADEIYSELVYEGKHVSLAEFLPEQTIVLNGLSKSHAMTGWRIGLLFAPANITQHIAKIHQYNIACPSSVSQRAAYAALTAGKDDALAMKEEYLKRRNYVMERFDALGIEYVKPDGAFYFFAKVPAKANSNSFDFAVNLAQEAKIAFVPGDAFSEFGEGYFRMSYACSMEDIIEGLNRFEKYLLNHNLI